MRLDRSFADQNRRSRQQPILAETVTPNMLGEPQACTAARSGWELGALGMEDPEQVSPVEPRADSHSCDAVVGRGTTAGSLIEFAKAARLTAIVHSAPDYAKMLENAPSRARRPGRPLDEIFAGYIA